MHENFNLLTVQNELGYTFKDAQLIKTAFIHRSYEAKGEESNVRLSFLGKHLLDFVLSDYITTRLPYTDEKELAFQTESYASALGTEKYIKEHSLDRFVMLSPINEAMRSGATVGRDIFYAIIAAIFRDGGLPALKSFLMPMIRACGGDTHYKPTTEGRIMTVGDDSGDNATHIKSERLRRPARSGSIGFSRAETIAAAEPEGSDSPKKEKGLSALLKKKDSKTAKKSDKIQNDAEKEAKEPDEGKKSFIRDPFAPVKLSDELRNFKPKKPSKYDEKPKPETISSPITESEPNEDSAEDANYKSLLQEHIQKNIRSASVLISYSTKQTGKGKWTAEVRLSDKVLAMGSGDSKKESEKSAAMHAYKAVCDRSSEAYKVFSSFSDTVPVTDSAPDYVSRINQHYQKLNKSSEVPIAYEKRNSGKKKEFMIAVMLDGKEIATGKADSLKQAKQNAAEAACKVLGI